MLDASGGSCQVLQLLAEHEKLRAEIEQLASLNHRYGQLAAERDQLHGEITRLEEDGNEADRRSRVLEIALAVRDRWLREALDEELLALGPPRLVPKAAIGARRTGSMPACKNSGKRSKSSGACVTRCGTRVQGIARQRIVAAANRADRGPTRTAAVDDAVAKPDRGTGSRSRRLGG